MNNFNIDLLKCKNFNVNLVEKKDFVVYMFTVDLYYMDEYIGYATSTDSNNTSYELIENREDLRQALCQWEGEPYSTELISIGGVKVEGLGITESVNEDIYRWIEGQVANWVKGLFN